MNSLIQAVTAKGHWKCTHCDHTDDREREILCWKCGQGQMVYVRPAERPDPSADRRSAQLPT